MKKYRLNSKIIFLVAFMILALLAFSVAFHFTLRSLTQNTQFTIETINTKIASLESINELNEMREILSRAIMSREDQVRIQIDAKKTLLGKWLAKNLNSPSTPPEKLEIIRKINPLYAEYMVLSENLKNTIEARQFDSATRLFTTAYIKQFEILSEEISGFQGLLELETQDRLEINKKQLLRTMQGWIIVGLLFILFIILLSARILYTANKSEEERLLMQQQIFHSSRLASIGTMAAGVAHEINNPLLIILMTLESIQEYFHANNNEEFLELTKKQEDAVTRIANIVKELGAYSRQDQDTSNFINITPDRLVLKTVNFLENFYIKEGIRIDKFLQCDKALVSVIPGKFNQIIVNLLSNAKDALHHRDVKEITIKTYLDTLGLNYVFEVSDTGCGIEEENMAMIFDAFFTTKPPGKGTGLGLWIINSAVESFRGKLSVESKTGVGTTFRISLPLATGVESTEEKIKMQANQKFSGSILLVDDEDDLRKLMKRQLERLGFSIDMAASAGEALEKLKTSSYDFIFSDVKMPNMNGLELLREIKKLNTHNKTHFVIVTGCNSSDDIMASNKDAVQLADAKINKPFSNELIQKTIADILQRKGGGQA